MEASFFQGEYVKSQRVLYTPSAFAKNNLFYLQETGTLTSQKPHISTRVNLSSFLFFIVEAGSGTVTYCGKEYVVSAGDCFFVDCLKPYSHQSGQELWTLRWVHFNGMSMHGIYDKFMERCGKPVFRADDTNSFSTILKTIFDTARTSDYVRDMKIFENLTSLLTQIMRQSWQPLEERLKTTSKLQLTEVKEYLDTHFQEKIVLDELSSRFYINKFYLSRVFKKEYGVSIMSYVLQNRITKAKQLLRFTDKTLTDIALEVGITEPYYFSRIFKQFEGLSPSEYRKSWLG